MPNYEEPFLVHPMSGILVAASDAVQALLEETRQQLVTTGDLGEVETLLRELMGRGSGAQRQRQAVEAGGLRGLTLLLESELASAPAGRPLLGKPFRSHDVQHG